LLVINKQVTSEGKTLVMI